MIFYFSGTGNSKHVAQSIASLTGDKQIAITKGLIKVNKIYKLEKEERIGFVFPVYWYSLPTLVVEFLKHLNISGYQSHYVYGVSTYGIAAGNVMKQLTGLLEEKKLPLKGKFGVKMVDNYVVGYPLISKEKQEVINKDADSIVKEIIVAIEKQQEVEQIHKGRLAFVSPLTGYAYKSAKHTHKFYATDSCNGCGLCEKACPCEVIHLMDGKPKWEGNCTFCLKCLHGCNKMAIQYGKGTLKRERYQYASF